MLFRSASTSRTIFHQDGESRQEDGAQRVAHFRVFNIFHSLATSHPVELEVCVTNPSPSKPPQPIHHPSHKCSTPNSSYKAHPQDGRAHASMQKMPFKERRHRNNNDLGYNHLSLHIEFANKLKCVCCSLNK